MRKIIHIDMDAFFASVEQREDPSLRGLPVIVGGSPHSRGVVMAASYESRKFGIHSAMPSRRAYQLCPKAIFISPHFEKYRQVSSEIREIFHEHTDLVEPLSLDEAYLDVTQNKKSIPFATRVAKEIRQRIFEQTNLTASAGVAPNKFLAKIASDMRKPNGLMVIRPEQIEDLLQDLPVRKIPGIGKVTEKKLIAHGIKTVGDLKKKNQKELDALFGKVGHWYYQVARGIDERPVMPNRKRKSVGVEDTFSQNIMEIHWLKEKLEDLALRVEKRLEKARTKGKTITLKVTYADFEKITRSKTLAKAFDDSTSLFENALFLMQATEAGKKPIRLLGISVSNLENLGEAKTNPRPVQAQFEFRF